MRRSPPFWTPLARGLTYAGADERFMDVSRRLAPPLLFDALAAQLGR